jgi:hypothetical protein
MAKWSSHLNSDPTDWLLEKDNPSVRYYTLREILGKPEKNSEVLEAKTDIMETGVVPKILSKQKNGGYWIKPEGFYTNTKYKGTVWCLIILAEHGADCKDKRIKDASEFIMTWSQDRGSGGFSYGGTEKNGGQPSGVIPCLTGNMVFSLIRFGYLDDPRIKKGIEWLAKYQRFDDGDTRAPKEWPYKNFEMCWGKHTCHMGAVKAMKALAEIPVKKRTKEVKKVLEEGAEYFLIHHIYRRSHNLNRLSKAGIKKLGFPLMWGTDVLEILGVMAKLGHRDERMQEAVDLVLSKQDKNGRWKLEHTFNGRFQVNIERKDRQSKWITLNALRMMKNYYK